MIKLIFGAIFALLSLSFHCVAVEGQTRVVEDAFGKKITVPENPKRIVVLSEIDLDSTLALGIIPVGSVNGRGQPRFPYYLENHPLLGSSVKAIPSVGELGQPNLEVILALEPDLILTMPNREEVLQVLSEIAPTVVTFSRHDDWKTTLRRIGEILGRQVQASKLVDEYQSLIATSKIKLNGVAGQSVSLVRWNPKGPAFMYRDSFASEILRDVGLVRPVHQQTEGPHHSLPLSLEALDQIDADWLLVGTLTPRGEATEALKQAGTTPTFLALDAVKKGHFFAVDGTLWTSVGGPIAAQQVVHEALQILVHRAAPKSDFQVTTTTAK
ncbi:Iron(III) dicitrate transport system, periplasmic iron-binding protein FecB (TC 3.A.1.14.1) [Pseudoalteromonas luteoviolacea B = ATCC 29581]|nr:Iron(III) dicitrate transport system, periplasmic iron-binding protein FecB (TC 3.A.1.14.1) [Pseudoalteromonas luteoviolacea B = ATCC 29581]